MTQREIVERMKDDAAAMSVTDGTRKKLLIIFVTTNNIKRTHKK